MEPELDKESLGGDRDCTGDKSTGGGTDYDRTRDASTGSDTDGEREVEKESETHKNGKRTSVLDETAAKSTHLLVPKRYVWDVFCSHGNPCVVLFLDSLLHVQ